MGIFKKEKKKRAFVCGFCHHSIDLSTEPDGQIKKHDGKPVCVVCRATKLSPLASLIKKGKIKYETDKKFLDDKSKQDALGEVADIAFASQQKAGENFKRLSPKKFLK
jgi:hypothetical protein